MTRRILALAGLAALAAAGGCSSGGGAVQGPAIDLTHVAPAEEAPGSPAIEHLRWVLDPEEQTAYLEFDEAGRAEFMRIRWAALDPTPTTPENERRDEHYRRLAYTREHFARLEPPGWDQRGELLLRYGSPDVRRQVSGDVVPGIGLVPPKEIWVYRWLGQAHELEDQRFQDDFQDAHRRRKTTRDDITVDRSRIAANEAIDSPRKGEHEQQTLVRDIDDLAADADEGPRMGRGRFQPIDAEKAPSDQQLKRLVSLGRPAVEETPQAYRHDYGGGQLEFAFDVVNFASPVAGRTRVEVHMAYRADDLGYSPIEAGGEAVLSTAAVVKSADYRDLDRLERRFTHRLADVEDTGRRLVLDQVVLDLEPGDYRLALSVRDSLTSRVGIFETPIDVREYREGRLDLSDVQIALNVGSAQPGQPFTKGGYQVVPFPLSTFPRDRDVFLYFEIYGLEAAPAGNYLYTVEFLLRPKSVKTRTWFGSSRGRLLPGVATAFDGVTEQKVVQEYLALDPSTFDEDVYDVVITVIDRVSDRKTSRSVRFAVQGE